MAGEPGERLPVRSGNGGGALLICTASLSSNVTAAAPADDETEAPDDTEAPDEDATGDTTGGDDGTNTGDDA